MNKYVVWHKGKATPIEADRHSIDNSPKQILRFYVGDNETVVAWFKKWDWAEKVVVK